MKVKTLSELKQDFAYMFDSPNIGISVPKGWMPIFSKLCQDIDDLLGQDKLGFHWTQCKEKFGSSRWYFSIENATPRIRVNIICETGVDKSYDLRNKPELPNNEKSISDLVGVLIDQATCKTSTSCVVCGEPGTIDKTGQYFLVMCKSHSEQRRKKQLSSDFWSD